MFAFHLRLCSFGAMLLSVYPASGGVDALSSLLTLGIVQTSLVLHSLNRSLYGATGSVPLFKRKTLLRVPSTTYVSEADLSLI